jgi:competence protein ComEC
MGGIASGILLPGLVKGPLISLVAAIATIAYLVLIQKPARLIPILAFFLIGYLLIQPWISPRFPSHHIIHHSDHEKWVITGKINSQPKTRGNRCSFILAAEHLERNGRFLPVTGRIRVSTLGPGLNFERGDRIIFESRLRRVRNFLNPGGFDYERYLAFKKVWLTAFCRENSIEVLSEQPKVGLYGLMERMRHQVSDLIHRLPPGDHRAVLAALIIGDRSLLTTERTETFHRIGIGHLLAISGLHIGIVASAVFLLLNRILSWIPWVLWKANSRKLSAIGAFPPVLIYAFLAGMSPSTQRALIMVAIFLMTFLIERDQDLLNSLALAAMALLVIYPPILFSISFQFSFTAVLSILYGMTRFQSYKVPGPVTFGQKILRKIVLLFLVSLWATIGTLPLTMYYFNQVSLIGCFSNIIFVPLIGFAVVPCGLLAAAILPLSPFIAEAVLLLSAGILNWSLKLVDTLSPLAFAAIRTITPSTLEIACYGILIWAIGEIVTKYKTVPISEREHKIGFLTGIFSRVRVIHLYKSVSFFLVVVLITITADVCFWSYQRYWRQDLRVTALDVGQGSAVLLQLPGGECILIDGGGSSDNAVFDMGSRVIAPFLWRNKIRTIDTIVLTHPNSDHLNGLLFIANHFHVKTVLTNGDSGKTHSYQQFLNIIRENGIGHKAYNRIERQFIINGVKIDILYPPSDVQERRQKDRWRNLNNNSIVIKATYGQISFLITGDIMARAEAELVSHAGKKLNSTVLVIPHHGSATSSSSEFVKAVQPLIGIVSAGWQNRYNFPHPEVIARYRHHQTRVLQTNHEGAIFVVTDGRKISVCTAVHGCDSSL